MTLQEIINALHAAATEDHARDAVDAPEGTLTCALSLTLVRELRDSLELIQGELAQRIEYLKDEVGRLEEIKEFVP